jgi:acyl-CoA synthetase (AMP-forming)/AMP-acid ligase II
MIHVNLIAPVHELLRRQAAARGTQIAYEDEGRAVTFAALETRTAALAGHLQRLGVEPGERVAIVLPNSVDFVEACLAIIRAGGLAVPISYDATEGEVSYRLRDAQCRLAFTTDEQAALVGAHLPETSADRPERLILTDRGTPHSGERFEALATQPGADYPRDPEDILQPAFVVYTSGTTGQAKGVLLSIHGMLWVTAACWAPIAGLNPDDRVLNALPLYHSYALNLAVLGILATGASEYIMERFSTTGILTLLQTRAVTVLPGVPTMFHYLLQTGKANGQHALSRIRLCLSAGAVMPGLLNRDFEQWFGVKLLDGYGITETSTMVTLNHPTGSRFMGSCGVPLPGLAVRLIDPATGIDALPGREGEITVRGPNVMLGYLDKPDATAAAIRAGWYHTGDLARQDENGFLTVTGRLKEIIIRGGQNIAPAEVEEAVSSFDPVFDCAVVGTSHPALGEVPIVFVVPREGHIVDSDALLIHCRSRLSHYKVPSAVHLVGEIPRTGSGKVMRYKLRAVLSD